MSQNKKVIIIGGGIGGLAAANLLAKSGYSVSVYEKNNQLGGRAGKSQIDDFTFDTGPSWYLMPKVFEQYFSLFDIDIEKKLQLTKLSPAYKVFFENNDPLLVTGNQKIDAALFESIEPGSGEKLNSYIAKGQAIYDLAIKHFLYTNFSSFKDLLHTEIIKNAPTMTKLSLKSVDSYVKGFVTDQRLKQILEYPMVFLGSSPYSAPALYSLMSALDFREGVYYPKGGLYKIIETMIEIGKNLGVTYHIDSAVEKIVTTNKKASGILLKNGKIENADIVISNADLHFTETQLLDKNDQSYPEKYWDKREAGPSALLMYLGVSGSLKELEHHNLFFTNQWKQNFNNIFKNKKLPYPASVYVCRPSATDPTVAPRGHENVFVLVPLPAGIKISSAQLEKTADRYLEMIEKQFNILDLRRRIVTKKLFGPDQFVDNFNAWQGTALGPSHILRQSAIFRTKNKSKKVKNLYYVGGSTLPGIGLPMCLISAQLVYKRITGIKRGGPLEYIRSEP